MGNTRKPGSANARDAITPQARVREVIAARLPAGSRLCVGLSGGLDSSVLLHILVQLRAELSMALSALHVHHGLSSNADAWAEHCRQLCQAWQVPLRVEAVTVAPQGKGLEAAARQARHAAFARQPADAIVLAHHLDDQIETFCMRLLRGAGPRGLSGMAEDSAWQGRRLLRPLLDVSRSRLEAYAVEHGISPVFDESNLDTRLTRNLLRQAWLPAVEARFPAYRRTLQRAMAHLHDSDALLTQLAREDVARLDDPARPLLSSVLALGEARGKNLLRAWLADSLNLIPGSAQLDALWRQLPFAGADAALQWRIEGGEVRGYRGRLHALPAGDPIPTEPRPWLGEVSLDWGAGQVRFESVVGQGVGVQGVVGKNCRLEASPCSVVFRPNPPRRAKPLRKWFQETGVPPWERVALPVLMVEGEPAWVAGLGVDSRYQARDGEPGWLISWRPRL